MKLAGGYASVDMHSKVRSFSVSARRALFEALLVTRCRNQAVVPVESVVNALLRTPSVAEFCASAGISLIHLPDAPGKEGLSYEACLASIDSELRSNGVSWGSPEHLKSVHPLPMHEQAQRLMRIVAERAIDTVVTPWELLLEIGRLDPAAASHLASCGLTEERISRQWAQETSENRGE
jgi:hypothetical protein